MIAKFDKVTNSMAEYGFYQFSESISEFKHKWKAGVIDRTVENDNNVDDDLQSITMEQMKKPIIILLCLSAIAIIIFVAEILTFKWLKWRNCKHPNIFSKLIHFRYSSQNILSFISTGRVQILPLVERQPKLKPQPRPDDLSSRRCHTAPPNMKNTKLKNTELCSRKCCSARV